MPGAAPRKMKIDDSSGLGTHKGYPYGRRFPGRGGPMWPPWGRFLHDGAIFRTEGHAGGGPMWRCALNDTFVFFIYVLS